MQLTFQFDARREPPDEAARRRIREDTASTLLVEAGAGAGKTSALVERIVSLVDQGEPIESIAAITFTEKAAADLRHRLRAALVGPGRQAAAEALDHAPIGTLHAFARRLLFEFPVEAGLPPGFTVLDELESQLALDERWQDLLDELLDEARREVAPGLSAAELVQLCQWGSFGGNRGLRRIVEDFQANWDLVEDRVQLDPPTRPDADVDTVLDRARDLLARPVPAGDGQETLLERLAVATDRLARAAGVGDTLRGLDALKQALRGSSRCGNRANWKVIGVDALDELRADELALVVTVDAQLAPWRQYRQAVVGAIAARFVLDGALARAVAGTLEFHDLLVLARRLLATQPTVRQILHDRYRRVLIDEFQDTDPIQFEIATRLTAAPEAQGRDASDLVPRPGRLFLVGDPKQSIYRFRRADIATYLAASTSMASARESLTANFRSSPGVIDWVNGVFSQVIEATDAVQPAYAALDACRPEPSAHGTVTVLGLEPHDEDLRAQDLRELEAASVAAAVATALRERWPVADGAGALRPCRAGDVAILLPARTSLPMLETALERLGVPYRAENASVVYVAPEIRDLMLALRAAADPTDELAMVAALRTPLYGCSDVELYDWRMAGGRWSPFADPPLGFEDHPVSVAIADVRSMARAVGDAGPAELLEQLVERRRVLEAALAGADGRDVWRRVRYVIDQARAWTDAGGRGLRRYLRWAAYQAAEGRASDTILPEHDHDAVRIMTVHAAKGLEFPITVLSGMTTMMRGTRVMSVVWPDGGWTLAERDNDVFEEFRPLDEQMGDAERRRLLYVACTRAIDHLVVSLHRKPESVERGTAKATSATVLTEAGAAGYGARVADPPSEALPRSFSEPVTLPWEDPAVWSVERARAIGVASIRSTTSATRIAHDAPVVPAPAAAIDPGLAKEGVDLDLPPWQRGRYGTAIGRAVHAVLQDADLATGADIDGLAAVQCAAEGIFGFESQVAALSRSALAAPIVRRAAGGAPHWRELFVVAELGATVLEGYVDLLVRTEAGLVIVDYKTDQWPAATERATRLAQYRRQLAAYGVALRQLLDEPISGAIVVRCLLDGPAEELPVERWDEALRELESTAEPATA